MSNIRSRVAKKTSSFIKKAQQAPASVPPPAAPVPGAPAPGAPPAAPKPPAAAPAAPGAPKPPMPGAPPAPGAPKSKEEIEMGVEQDIKRRKEQEKKIEDLDTKVTSISDQLEGLTKSLNKFINTFQEGKGQETDFDNKYKELQDEEGGGKKPSSSEFGLGKDDSLVVSKEGQKMSDKAALRKARKERLKAKKMFEETEAPDKKYKQQVPAPQITKLKKEPGDWDKYDIKASNMAMELSASKDEWVIMDKNTNQPFFKLHPNTITAEVFATKEFAEQVIRDAHDLGMQSAMEKYSAEPMDFLKKDDEKLGDKPVGKPGGDKAELLKKKLLEKKEKPGLPMKKDDKPMLPKKEPGELEEEACSKTAQEEPAGDEPEEAVEPEEAAEEAPEEAAEEAAEEETIAEDEVTEEHTASMQDLQRRFVRAFRLAMSAQHKNLAENPLKAAWYEVLKSMEVENPERIIEATFARAASEHFEVAMAKTAEYLELSDESFIELEAQIGELNTAPPMTEEEAVQSERQERAAAMRARAARSSLPVSSVTDAQPVSVADQISNALPKPKLHGISQFRR